MLCVAWIVPNGLTDIPFVIMNTGMIICKTSDTFQSHGPLLRKLPDLYIYLSSNFVFCDMNQAHCSK